MTNILLECLLPSIADDLNNMMVGSVGSSSRENANNIFKICIDGAKHYYF